jgi:hypothetical protein
MDKSICKHAVSYSKISKNKTNGKLDTSKAPSLRAKIPFYDGKWVLKSSIPRTLSSLKIRTSHPLTLFQRCAKWQEFSLRWNLEQRKGMGRVTWKFVQCMVKPNDVQSVVGRPMFQLSSEEIDGIER